MTDRLERALADLAASTEALLSVDRDDLAALTSAIERRADAITKIAFLAEEGASPNEHLLRGLESALAKGKQATGNLSALRRETLDEWMRVNQLDANIGQPSRHHISYSG